MQYNTDPGVLSMEGTFSKLRQVEHHIDDTVRLYPNEQTDDYPAHWHNAFEVILPVENGYTVIINDEVYSMQPGEVIIIPGGVVHELYAPETGMRYVFMIDQSQFYHVEGIAAVQHCFYPCAYFRKDSDAEVLAKVRNCLMMAIEEYQSDRYFNRSAVRMWLGLMFIQAGRALLDREETRGGETQHHHQTIGVFLDVCSYIANHCREKLTLDDVAAYSGYSKYHFSRMFKEYAGMSFYDFFIKQRLMQCERLLSDLSLSITEVAMRSGFGSIATFNRIFKQHEGITPTEYRTMLQHVFHSPEKRNI